MAMRQIHLFSLCVGCIIGWGAFILPQDLFLSRIGLFESLVALLIGAFAMAIIAYNFSILWRKFPQAIGGELYFTLQIFGRKHAFICGWFLLLSYLCIIALNATALVVVWDSFGLFELGDFRVFVGAFGIVIVGLLHIFGLQIAFILQNILTMLLIGCVILFFIMMGFEPHSLSNLATHIKVQFDMQSMLITLSIMPWAYLGFDCVMQVVHSSSKGLHILVNLALFAGFMLYAMLLCVLGFGMAHSDLSSEGFAIHDVLYSRFGFGGSLLLGVAILGAILSGINGFFIAMERLFEAFITHKYFTPNLAKHNRFGAKYRIVLLVMCLATTLSLFGRDALLYIIDVACVGVVIGFVYVGVGAVRILAPQCFEGINWNCAIKDRRYLRQDRGIRMMILKGFSCAISVLGLLLGVGFFFLIFVSFFPLALKLYVVFAAIAWALLGLFVLWL